MERQELVVVFNFFEKSNVVAIELTGNLKLGETIRIVGSVNDFTEVVDSIQIEGNLLKRQKLEIRLELKFAKK